MKAEYTMSCLPDVEDEAACISIMTAKLADVETEELLASCEIYFVDFVNGSNITDCHDLLDMDGVTYEFAGLFDDEYSFHGDVAFQIDPFFSPNRLVIIHKLEVPKEHRGKKLSKALIDDIERRFVQDVDAFALKAFPLENRTEETTKSLTQYYESIGFVRTGVNDILIKTQL